MRRRAFLLAAAGAAALRPAAALAQPARVPTVGVLVTGKPDPGAVLQAFREGLQRLGYIEGRNIGIEVRSAEGDTGRLSGLAADLVRDKADIIAVWQTPPALAAKQATSRIPIVMLGVGDPVRDGLVAGLARPGGNITGMAAQIAELGGKNLELLRQAIPSIRRAGVLALAGSPFSDDFVRDIEASGQRLGIAIHAERVAAGAALDTAFTNIARERVDALVAVPNVPIRPAARMALDLHLPAAAPWPPFAAAGGLLAYAFNLPAVFRHAAMFVDKILKGAKPADLPVEQPTTYHLTVNQKTAALLGITLPPLLLAQADEVIE